MNNTKLKETLDERREVKIAELIEDFSLYPRSQVDGSHVTRLSDAIEAGEKLPDILVDNESYRIIDGWHRSRAFKRNFGKDAKIYAILRKYPTEKEMYLDALRLNARHGKVIAGSEQTGAIIKAQNFKISTDVVAAAMGISQERINEIIGVKVGKIIHAKGSQKLIPLKRSVSHLKLLTQDQANAMDIFPGQPQSLLLKQINKIIETNCLDMENQQVVDELRRLKKLINKINLE